MSVVGVVVDKRAHECPWIHWITDSRWICRRRLACSSSPGRCPLWRNSRRFEVHRCPAVPTAAKSTARSVRSRSASSMTMMPLFPPSSRRLRPIRLATVCPICDPWRPSRWPRSGASEGRSSGRRPGVGRRPQIEDRGRVVRLEHPSRDLVTANASAGSSRRFPNQRVAAHRRYHGVPGPDCNREVERRDDADGPEWVPLLVHPVLARSECIERP